MLQYFCHAYKRFIGYGIAPPYQFSYNHKQPQTARLIVSVTPSIFNVWGFVFFKESMSKESWKAIAGFENYDVSSWGRVRNTRFNRILKPFGYPNGSKGVNLYLNGQPVRMYVRELVLRAFVGEIPPGHMVVYLDGNRSNERLENLRYIDCNKRLCSVCGKIKDIDCFHETKGGVLGKKSRCKDCSRKVSQSYYERNKEYLNERRNEWAKNNRERITASRHKRRARETEAGGSYTVEEFKALCKQYGNRCLACGKKGKLTADHVVPVIAGGSSNISNIQPLCLPCNSSKGKRVIDFR